MEKTKPVLSISMLVSNNRRDTIEKCLESLAPLLKAVPSELIIVDTGCTDGSVDIARKYADKVVQFTWCKDFAAARNAGLRECTGEWFLYLDDDEWFEDVSELITFFKSEERKHCDTLWYIQRNYDDFEGTSYTDTYVGRCLKMTPETRFCGKIHEWLEPLPKMIKKTNAYVHHYGYVFKNEEDKQKHLERNLTLEEEAVRENPEDIRMCCQLVQEYWVARRFDDAIKLAKDTLGRTDRPQTDAFVQYLSLVIPRLYKGQEKNEAALEEFVRLEKEFPLMHQTKLGLFYERAMTYGGMKREEDLIKAFKQYLDEFHVLPKEGDPVEHPVMDFAQYQSDLFYHRAVEYSVSNMICGDLYDYAEEIYERMDWKQTAKPKEMLAALFRCYEETGKITLLAKHLPVALQEPELEVQVYGAIHALYEKYQRDANKSNKLLADLESLKLCSGNFPFFHLLYTERQGTTTEQDIKNYYENSDRKYDEEVALLLLGKAEKKLFFHAEQKMLGSIAGVLKEYIDCAKNYAGAAYGSEFWDMTEVCETSEIPTVPGEIAFAHIMNGILEVEDGAVFGAGVKRALKFHPTMLPVMKALLEERELMALAKQLKSVVRANLIAGKTEEAMALLSELARMLPEDEEVKELLAKA